MKSVHQPSMSLKGDLFVLFLFVFILMFGQYLCMFLYGELIICYLFWFLFDEENFYIPFYAGGVESLQTKGGYQVYNHFETLFYGKNGLVLGILID